MVFDVHEIRAQFPAIIRKEGVFLDNPAGTQVPQRVIDAVSDYYLTMNANSGGMFETSLRTDKMVHVTREKVADFLNAPDVSEIVFGQNMTSLAFGLSRAVAKTLKAGDEIVLTRMDHDANVAPWLRIAEDYDLVIRWVDIRTSDCTLDMDSLESVLTDRTKLVATVHASNAVGTINPVARIAEMAHAAGALMVVDAVQSAPHIPIDVQAIDCDFLLCSAYKFFGPHIGIMWGRGNLLNSLPVYKVRPSKDQAPYRWETGTPSFETIAAVGAAIDYLAEIGHAHDEGQYPEYSEFQGRRRDLKVAMSVLGQYERELTTHLVDVLLRLPGVTIAGITDQSRFNERVPTVVFVRDGYAPKQIAAHLASKNIYVWDGNYYAVEIMQRLGRSEDGMVRVGLAHYNSHEEIDLLISALQKMD